MKVHYMLNCPEAQDSDMLALTPSENDQVNCETCVREMIAVGVIEIRSEA